MAKILLLHGVCGFWCAPANEMHNIFTLSCFCISWSFLLSSPITWLVQNIWITKDLSSHILHVDILTFKKVHWTANGERMLICQQLSKISSLYLTRKYWYCGKTQRLLACGNVEMHGHNKAREFAKTMPLINAVVIRTKISIKFGTYAQSIECITV